MLWVAFLPFALSAEPEINVTWKGAHALLLVRAPEGEHLAPDAPFDVEVRVGERSVVLATLGDDGEGGVPLGDARGTTVSGVVRFSLCEDKGSRCRLLDVSVAGDIDTRKRGTVALRTSRGQAPEASTGFPARVDARTVLARAIEEGRTRSLPVLIDFGAVWCPPCQLMDTELFLAPRRPAVVDAFVLARLDVDDPSSWDAKDRYDVEGYPTIVAVEADGTEIGRLVGYPGFDATVSWLDDVATGRYKRQPGDPSAVEAGVLAWRAVQEGKPTAARALLPIAAAEPDRAELRLARLHLEPTLADATWLAERAPGTALQWVGAAGPVRDLPEGRVLLRRALEADLATAKPVPAADLLALLADLADTPEARRVHYAAAAALIRGQLTGNLNQDKGHLNWLAELTERAGRPEEAVLLLRRAADAFPSEPTFHQDLARLELRQGHGEEALAAADRALEQAWGDNRLTAAKVRAEALVALGRMPEARTFVAEILAETPTPSEGVDVRTRRYRDQLQAVVSKAAP